MKFGFKRVLRFISAVTALSFVLGSVSAFAAEAEKYYFDVDYNKSGVSSIPNDAITIIASPSKDQLNVGDEFYVDFIIKNNKDFATFGFEISYDNSVIIPVKGNIAELNKAAEVKYDTGDGFAPAVSAGGINSAIEADGGQGMFCYTNLMLDVNNYPKTSIGDGILFRVNFRAVGNGMSNIDIDGRLKVLLGTIEGVNLPVYVSNASVTVGDADTSKETTKTDEKLENTTEKVTETTTESTSGVTEKETSTEIKNSRIKINVPKDRASARQFTDIASVPWAKDSIDMLSSLGIINGVSDVTFNPKAYTTRGDFMLVMSRLLGLEGQASSGFADVDSSKYYANAIGLTKGLGIANGVDQNRFMPDANISRQDVMVIVSRTLEKIGVLKKGDVKLLENFSDNGYISPYARQAMADLIEMGIVKGDGGMLKPANNITRAEMAVIMKNVYDIIK